MLKINVLPLHTISNKMIETKTFSLKEIPREVIDIIYEYQLEAKKRCRCSVNLEKTIYKIIRAAKENNIKLYK